MKEIKVLLFSLYIACLTSSWWALAMFGPTGAGWVTNPAKIFPVFLFPLVFTIICVMSCIFYIAEHWNDK